MKKNLKKPFGILIILILSFCMTACDEGSSDENVTESAEGSTQAEEIEMMDGTDNIKNGKAGTYQYGNIAFTIPESWSEKYNSKCEIRQDKTGYIEYIDSVSEDAGWGGIVATIMIMESSENYTELPSYKHLGSLKQEGFDYNIVVLYPTDVQFDPENRDTYEALAASMEEVFETAEGLNGCTFTPSN